MSQINALLGTTMYVSEESANELVIQSKKPSLIRCILTFSLFTLFTYVIPGFMLIPYALAPLRVLTVSCNRVEPNLVKCEYAYSELFGLIQKPSTKTGLIEEAKLSSEDEDDGDGGTYTIYSVALVENNLLNPHIIYHSHSHKIAAKITANINSFINSEELFIFLEQRGWEDGGMTFFDFFTVAFTVMWFTLSPFPFLEMIKTIKNPRYLSFSRTSNLCTDKCGNKIKEYRLGEITCLELEKDEDSDGPDSYILKLLLSSGEQYLLLDTVDEQEAGLVKGKIENFLTHIR